MLCCQVALNHVQRPVLVSGTIPVVIVIDYREVNDAGTGEPNHLRTALRGIWNVQTAASRSV
jgi:hypothetical protein